MKYKYMLFDLDGTLTDPMIGITRSVQYALRSYGIEEPDLNRLCPFIGPPLKDSFIKFYGFPEEQAREAIDRYREYFAVTGLFENKEYPGIHEMLGELKRQGAVLLVATSKPEVFSRQILKHFHMDTYFDFIGGADMEETRVRKGEVIRYVLEESGITDVSRAVMIGDREHDILGARENGMDSIGVLYGYGNLEEHQEAGADAVAATVGELAEMLLA